MKRLFTILIFLSVFNASIVYAAPDPAEVEELKENAPLHVTGEVVADQFISDDKSFPSQKRSMQLQVQKIIKKTNEVELAVDDTITIF